VFAVPVFRRIVAALTMGTAPGHPDGPLQAFPWLAARFAGAPAPSTC
jgi:hypothetical protein